MATKQIECKDCGYEFKSHYGYVAIMSRDKDDHRVTFLCSKCSLVRERPTLEQQLDKIKETVGAILVEIDNINSQLRAVRDGK